MGVCISWQDFSSIIPPQRETQRNQNPLNELYINLSPFQGYVKKTTTLMLIKENIKGSEKKKGEQEICMLKNVYI